MKTLKYFLFIIVPLFALYGCEDDSGSNPVFGEDDYPFIYVTWQENMAYKLGATMKIEPQVSPTDGVEYKWTLDGEEIGDGKQVLEYQLNEYLLNAELKLEVTRYGQTNSRTAKILVVKDFEPKVVKHKAIAWLTQNGQVTDVNWENISQLIISSVVVKEDGTLDTSVLSTLDIPVILAFAHHYGVQVMVEVSGVISYLNAVAAYDSWTFYNNAIGNPDKLVASIQNMVKDNNFDGVNIYMDKAINGAYEKPEELKVFYQRFGEVFKSSKNTVDGKEYDYLLTMSVYSGWTNAALLGMVNIPEYDWINVLAFGAEDLTPGPHASNWFATSQTEQWLNWYGVAPQRVVLAVPAFGLRYFGQPKDYTWGNLWQFTEYISYRDICTKYPDAPSKNYIIVIENDNDPNKEVDKTFYDGLNDVKSKAQFAVDKNLGGIALWSLESDTKDPATSLIKAINDILNK